MVFQYYFLFLRYLNISGDKMSVSDDESVLSMPMFSPPPAPPVHPPPPFSRTAVTAEPNGLQRDISYSNFTADPLGDGQRAYRYAASVIP